MLHPFVQAVIPAHDTGVRQGCALSARLAYVLLWPHPQLGRSGQHRWVHPTDRTQATRNQPLVLATLTMAFGLIHVWSFYLTMSTSRSSS